MNEENELTLCADHISPYFPPIKNKLEQTIKDRMVLASPTEFLKLQAQYLFISEIELFLQTHRSDKE